MGITPLTKDPSSIELTFPTMLGQEEFRQLGYYLIDRVARHLYQVRLRSPYRPVSEKTRQALELLPLPDNGVTAEEIVAFFEERIQPYPTFGTGHPRGFGWIAGGPDPMAVLGSLLAAALNPNCIGGDQSATYLDLAVLRWLKELVDFPTMGSAGLLLSGGTQATLVCLMAARHAAAVAAGWNPRTEGLQRYPTPLVLYASEQTHHCVAGAVEVLGLGQHHLRSIASTEDFQLDLAALHAAVRRDREDDLQPFCVVANAGTTNTGAIDPLAAIADFCEREGLWFHVDGSYGAFGRLDPRIASRYCGMERADSLTLDPHKWLSVPMSAAAPWCGTGSSSWRPSPFPRPTICAKRSGRSALPTIACNSPGDSTPSSCGWRSCLPVALAWWHLSACTTPWRGIWLN